jgi:acetyl-CoA synthetase
MSSVSPAWWPTPDGFARSRLAELELRLSVRNFEQLHRLSLEAPDVYWNEICSLSGITWARPPTKHVDFSGGREFPRWFVGGSINWVESVLNHATTPAARQRVAVVAEHENGTTNRLTYEALGLRVASLAAGFRTQGLGVGDRIGLMMPMGIEAVLTLLAIGYVGAIAVPLFTGFGSEAVRIRLELAGARALVIGDGWTRRGRRIDLASVAGAAARRLPDLRLIVVKRYDAESSASDPASMADWNRLAATSPAGPVELVDPNHPCLILFTSGTTGAPKGTVHSHGGFPLKVAHDALVHFDLRPGDRWFWPADMGWMVGPLVTIAGLIHGATVICYDGAPDLPDWSRTARIIRDHGVTHFGASPSLIRGLAANGGGLESNAANSLRILISAGEVIDPEHFAWYGRAIGGSTCPIINYTGGTEASGALLANIIERPIVPCGFNAVSPGVEVDVVDESGASITDTVGELVVRRPFVGMTAGFWHDAERYLDTYWRTHPGIWVHGDLAIKTRDGVHFLLGRSDDSLKIAGRRVGPAEVEAAALAHPDVVEAAAIGAPDPMKGEQLILFAVLRAGFESRPGLESELGDSVERDLGRPFRPARVHIAAELPRTRNGKVMRRLIRRVYLDQPPGDISALENPRSLELIARSRDLPWTTPPKGAEPPRAEQKASP